MRRVLAVALVVIVLALALAACRAYFASRAQWRTGEALVLRYNRLPRDPPAGRAEMRERRAAMLHDAVVAFREAALWYLPGNPYVRRSLERLLTIGQRAEEAADDPLALYAYRAARSAILGTRGLLPADDEALQRADAGIARVAARVERPAAPGAEPVPMADRERAQLALLAPPQDPDPWLALLAALGLLGWVGGVLGFALRAIDERCRVRARPALWAGLVIVCGLAAWAAGLAWA